MSEGKFPAFAATAAAARGGGTALIRRRDVNAVSAA